jgi:hypothetical protein
MAIASSVAGLTIKLAEPVRFATAALIDVWPGDIPSAPPPALTVATFIADGLQVADFVRSSVLPSE